MRLSPAASHTICLYQPPTLGKKETPHFRTGFPKKEVRSLSSAVCFGGFRESGTFHRDRVSAFVISTYSASCQHDNHFIMQRRSFEALIQTPLGYSASRIGSNRRKRLLPILEKPRCFSLLTGSSIARLLSAKRKSVCLSF